MLLPVILRCSLVSSDACLVTQALWIGGALLRCLPAATNSDCPSKGTCPNRPDWGCCGHALCLQTIQTWIRKIIIKETSLAPKFDDRSCLVMAHFLHSHTVGRFHSKHYLELLHKIIPSQLRTRLIRLGTEEKQNKFKYTGFKMVARELLRSV